MNVENNDIRISVIIPVYNEEKYIEECMKSLISQSFPRDQMEWIAIDGYSTDHSLDILKRFEKDYPLRILFNDKRSAPAALNMGIKNARGRYILRLDAHAEFPPDYIEKSVKCMETTDADCVGGFVETKATGDIGEAIAKILSSRFGVGGSAFRTGEKSGYVDTVPFGMYRREIFDTVGLFNESLLRSEDNDLNARIIENGGKIYLSKEINSIYYCRDTVLGLIKQCMQNGNALFRTTRQNPRAMRLRHFVPFLFLMSLLLFLIIGLFSSWAWYVLAAEIAAYLLLDFWYSFCCGSPKKGLITIWLYPLYHLTYGFGSLLGLMGIHLY